MFEVHKKASSEHLVSSDAKGAVAQNLEVSALLDARPGSPGNPSLTSLRDFPDVDILV